MAALLKGMGMKNCSIISLQVTPIEPAKPVPGERYYCPAEHDGWLCWAPTLINSETAQNCPPVRFSDTTRMAFRICGQAGKWLDEDNIPNEPGFTNYTECFAGNDELIKFIRKMYNGGSIETKMRYAEYTRIMEFVGFFLSLIALIVSIYIFSCYRALQNSRTKLHLNLFIAILCNVIFRLVIYGDMALQDASDEYHGFSNKTYLCESLYVCMEYTSCCMLAWMFVEGHFMNKAVAANQAIYYNNHFTFYCCLGWGVPILLTSVWAAVTAVEFHSRPCWWGYPAYGSYWILEGPRLFILLVNIIYLIKIVWSIYSKMKITRTSELIKIRVAVRATLLLMPLFGLSNVLNRLIDVSDQSDIMFGVWSLATHFFTSFQGIGLSLLYCFLNTEVRTVLGKAYRDYHARRIGRRGRRRRFAATGTANEDRTRWLAERERTLRELEENLGAPATEMLALTPSSIADWEYADASDEPISTINVCDTTC